jgi:hypothetical protein
LPIIFNSYDTGDKPIIDGNDTILCLVVETQGDYTHPPATNYINFQDLKFIHGKPYNVSIWNSKNITFENCEFDSNRSTLTESINLYIGQGSDLKVNNCILTNTDTINGHGSGIYLDGVDNAIIENTIIDGGKSGIRIGFGDVVNNWPGHTDNLIVRYCTIKNQSYDCIDDDGAVNSQFYYNLFESSKAAGFHEILYIFSPGEYNEYVPHDNSYFNNTFINHLFEYSGGYTIEINTYNATANNLTFKNNLFYTENLSDNRNGRILFNRSNPGTWNFDNNIYYLSGGGYDKLWVPNEAITDTPLVSFAAWQSYNSHNYDEHSKIANPSFTNFPSSIYTLDNSSPATLAGTWVGLNYPDDKDIIGTKIGNPPDIGAYQNSTYWSGPISSNRTMSGNVAIIDSITVNTGDTLTISPGTHIKVENGSNIRVNGTLKCQIDEDQGNITIDTILTNNKRGYIIFDGSSASNSVFQSVSIRHGAGIQCLNGANVLIENSRLDSCTQGIYIYNSAPRIINDTIYDPLENAISGSALNLSPYIRGNVMTRSVNSTENEGIYLGPFTYPYILNNYVNYFDYGIYIGGGSTSWFHEPNFAGPIPNNRSTNNTTGICSGWGSIIWAGDSISAHHGDYNSIVDNLTECISYQYSALYARHNYWGEDADFQNHNIFFADGTSLLDYDNHLTTDPWDMQNSDKNITGGSITSNNHLSKSIVSDDPLTGLQLESDGRIDDAVTFYKNLITEDKFVRIALSQLSHIKYKYGKNELANYFGSLLTVNQKNYSTVKNVIGGMYLQNNQFDNAMTAYDDVIRNYSTDYDGISARFEKLFAYLHIKKDPVTASRILSEIKGLNSDEREVKMNIKIAESLLSGYNKVLGKNANLQDNKIPKTYSLAQNFPNPFNPSTIIRYQIPKPGLVTLKVYDILGREVATLVNENKVEGSYDFAFNASRYASGVYIYQLRVNDYVSSKKMLLLK